MNKLNVEAMSIQGQQLNVCYTQQALHDCVSLLEEFSVVCWCARIYHVDVFKERRASNSIDMRICIIHRYSNILAFLLRTTQLGPIFNEAEGARVKKLPAQSFFFCGGTKSPGWERERGTNT